MNVGQTNVVLAPPRTCETDRVREIVRSTGVFRPDEVDIALEVFEEAVAKPGKDYRALAAFEDEQIVGFALYGPTPCTLGTWDLYWLVVDSSWHRRGIGRRLLQAAEDDIKQCDGHLIVIETSSRDDYVPTRLFYEARGYQRAADIPGYYALGDDLIVFTKHLVLPEEEMASHG